MVFIAESITTFYDKEQDRLSLIFNGKDKKQLLGHMTRQFFKGLLIQLPDWLSQHHTNALPKTSDQQWEINHLYHQISQQNVAVTYGKIQSSHQIQSFLIHTINLTKTESAAGDQKIKLEFLDSTKTTEIIFVLHAAQLHKLIGEIFKQVRVWDIDNPWQEKNTTPFLPDTKVVH